MEKVDVLVPPVATHLDGAVVYILEVIKYRRFDGAVRYIVSCIVEYNGYRSRQFQLDVENEKDLKSKLRVEVAKMQLMIESGFTEPFSKIS